jgi:hypothetical protein
MRTRACISPFAPGRCAAYLAGPLSAGHAGVHRAPEAAASRLPGVGVIGLVQKYQRRGDKESG